MYVKGGEERTLFCRFNGKIGAWNHVLYTSTSLGREKN
jgi:hypothetical protein